MSIRKFFPLYVERRSARKASESAGSTVKCVLDLLDQNAAMEFLDVFPRYSEVKTTASKEFARMMGWVIGRILREGSDEAA